MTRLAFDLQGEGADVVVLLHGIGGGRSIWSDRLSGTVSAIAGLGCRAVAVDLPGYGFAKVSQRSRRRWEQMIENYLRKRENLSMVFVLIDSRHSPQAIDLEFVNQLGEWQIPFVLVFTKIDKNKPGATLRHCNEFFAALSENWEEPPPHYLTSATTRAGRKEILDYIYQLNQNFKRL